MSHKSQPGREGLSQSSHWDENKRGSGTTGWELCSKRLTGKRWGGERRPRGLSLEKSERKEKVHSLGLGHGR